MALPRLVEPDVAAAAPVPVLLDPIELPLPVLPPMPAPLPPAPVEPVCPPMEPAPLAVLPLPFPVPPPVCANAAPPSNSAEVIARLFLSIIFLFTSSSCVTALRTHKVRQSFTGGREISVIQVTDEC